MVFRGRHFTLKNRGRDGTWAQPQKAGLEHELQCCQIFMPSNHQIWKHLGVSIFSVVLVTLLHLGTRKEQQSGGGAVTQQLFYAVLPVLAQSRQIGYYRSQFSYIHLALSNTNWLFSKLLAIVRKLHLATMLFLCCSNSAAAARNGQAGLTGWTTKFAVFVECVCKFGQDRIWEERRNSLRRRFDREFWREKEKIET